MEDSKRATVYFDAAVHQALRLKAAATDRSISDMVNDAVKVALAEDAEDLPLPARGGRGQVPGSRRIGARCAAPATPPLLIPVL